MRAIFVSLILLLSGCFAAMPIEPEPGDSDSENNSVNNANAANNVDDSTDGGVLTNADDVSNSESDSGDQSTCSDGVQNGNETGVDCGGSCAMCGATCPDDQDCSATECGPDPVCAMECGMCNGARPICQNGSCIAANGNFPGGLNEAQVIGYWSADQMAANNGDAVDRWDDLSGSSYDFVAPNGRQPMFSATGLNGRPTIVFDGDDDALVLDDIGVRYEEPYVMYIVYQGVSFNSDHAIMSKSPGSSIDAKLVFGFSRGQYVVRNCDAVTQAGHFYGGEADTDVHLARKDHASDDRLFIDDMSTPVISYSDNTQTIGPCGSGNKNPFYAAILGIRENFERGANVKISAIYIVDAPTDAQKSAIESDLKSSWGL